MPLGSTAVTMSVREIDESASRAMLATQPSPAVAALLARATNIAPAISSSP